jgi:hypothetical protein
MRALLFFLSIIMLAGCAHGRSRGAEKPARPGLPDDSEMECPKRFGASARSRWHDISGERYYVDSFGRPARAETRLPPIETDERNPSCQLRVGKWGDDEDAENDYDGGHLIGSQLGGWGARANMVPQNDNFNRGNWAQLENCLARCTSVERRRFTYLVEVHYPDASTLIPDAMKMNITDTEHGEVLSLKFENADGGGANGNDERKRGVDWLHARGCE